MKLREKVKDPESRNLEEICEFTNSEKLPYKMVKTVQEYNSEKAKVAGVKASITRHCKTLDGLCITLEELMKRTKEDISMKTACPPFVLAIFIAFTLFNCCYYCLWC